VVWNRINPFFLFLSLSLFIHGAVLWLAAEGPFRPFNPDETRAVPVSLLSLMPRSAPVNIPPEVPAPQAAPAPRVREALVPSTDEAPPPAAEESAAPAITATDAASAAENTTGAQAQESGYPPVSPSFVRPDVREAAIKRYAAMIRGLIDRRKEYPYQARRQNQEGSVQIRFILSRQGVLNGEPVMEKQSRYRHLNESALEAVKNAAPFPPFPEEIREEEMSFQVVVSFSL
jgi:protein TonB